MGVWCSRNYHPVLPNIGVENPWKATFLDHLPSGFHHAFSTSRGTDRWVDCIGSWKRRNLSQVEFSRKNGEITEIIPGLWEYMRIRCWNNMLK
jgi:hypothetical protein